MLKVISIPRVQCRSLTKTVLKQPRSFCVRQVVCLYLQNSKMSTSQPNQTQKVIDSEGKETSNQRLNLGMGARVRILKEMNYRLTVNESETEALVHLPGLSYESFDRDGNVSLCSLMRLMASGRYFAYHTPLDETGHTFLDYSKMTEDRFTFMASSEIDIERVMYDQTVLKSPLDFRFQLGYIGKSSLNSVGTLLIPSTGQELARNINQIVGTGKITRRPVPLPDWWREKFAESAVRKEPLIMKKMAKPRETYRYEARVSWSDTDGYNHTNWASYVLYCINALHHGIKDKFFKNITKEIVKNGVKKIRMAFIGESLEGDCLAVHVWECPDEPFTVFFDIHKNDETIYQSTISYFS